jgi:hypothetical protein
MEPEAPPPVLERLHALVRKGYKPEIGTDTDTDVIALRHVGKAPDLLLHSDGRVEAMGGRVPRYKSRIEPPEPFAADRVSEQLRFMKFLDSVPKASLRDRTRRFRHRYVYLPAVFAILLAIHLAFTAIIMSDDDEMPPPPPEAQAAIDKAVDEAVEGATAANRPAGGQPQAPQAPGAPAPPALINK